MPVETSLPAADFGCEFFLDSVHSVRFITGTSHILNVEEGRSADIPNNCCHHQRQHPTTEEGHFSTEQRVSQEDEGREQQQSPTPGQFDKVTAKDNKKFTIRQVVKFIFKLLHGINTLVIIHIYVLPTGLFVFVIHILHIITTLAIHYNSQIGH